MLRTFLNRRAPAGVAGTYLRRAASALAGTTATYGIPLLVFVSTGSTALTGLAFLLEWTLRLSAFVFAGSLVHRSVAAAVACAATALAPTSPSTPQPSPWSWPRRGP